MSDKSTELGAAALSLADFAARRLDSRRNFEMKMSFGVWALIAAAIYRGFDHLSIFFGLFVILIYGWFMWGVYRRNTADSQAAWHYFNQGASVLNDEGITPAPDNSSLSGAHSTFLNNWAVGPQLAITAGLLIALYISSAKHVDLFATDLRAEVVETGTQDCSQAPRFQAEDRGRPTAPSNAHAS